MSKYHFFPEEIIFSATDSCNLHCPHCYVSRTPNKLSIDDAKRFILSCNQDIQKIGFSGGEPFLYKEFLLELTKFVVSQDLYFDQIMTNGDWWKDENNLVTTLQELYNAGYDGKIGLSWDNFHGQDKNRMEVFIKTVLDIFGDSSINIQFVKDNNSLNTNHITIEEIQNLFPQITIYPLEQSFTGDSPLIWNSKKWFNDDYCQGPGNILYVHSNGNIAPCCGFANENEKLIIGTIKDDFSQIMKNASENQFIKLCFEDGLKKGIKLLKQQKIKLPGKCNDICSFCDYVCKNLK